MDTPNPPDDFKPSRTLGEVLSSIENFDDSMLIEIGDAAAMLQLEKDGDDLRAKVDSTVRYIERREWYGDYCRSRAAELVKRAQAAENGATRLRDYVLFWMAEKKYDRLPGHASAIVRKQNAASMRMLRAPTAADALNDLLAPFVERVPASYRWGDGLKEALKSGDAPALSQVAELYHNEKIEFRDADEPAVKKRKGKAP